MPSKSTDAPQRIAYGVDIHAGDTYLFDRYRLTEQQIIDFARQWDQQRFHIEKDFAGAGIYHGLIASGLQTICVFQRLATLAMFSTWSIVAGHSSRDARFLRPATHLTGTATIRAVEFDGRGRALVTLSAG
ncbi:MAG: dehydratase [Rhodanobacter sp.]|nr:MAG: dehydratase [Rhodanobacter sp.]TAL97382.1 MAG: dehydratase [Rhodanobacter sp.]TAM43079.1 MAG: dehydratase [Rhodanobacter sp.]TAN28813.1 MAG: dehydratase [Rhodanobacter sp.]